ncbi:MAG: hypothetical protein DRR16_03280 [Candidatus Parabeggiatoa sp. nov. 3]|nr:MAG: hypothetical protein DRR00_05540 [Gammaproteobacteria bacterium]RKZ67417.1 MAG: hypothetical protein DRQ99_06795 [Gammaproteobacteria bacterium]RKZ89149.1 MAG: hypothetical protein DRR16_03280 [Gammaproteobacteria bacterium]HEW98483.1 hypothetical protein [Beggiatoa sp.]
MKWAKIKALYPNKFILLGNIVEEPISSNQFKILEGEILMVSEDAKEIRQAYQAYNRQGKEVLYSLPSTPKEFIVENVPLKGILQ